LKLFLWPVLLVEGARRGLASAVRIAGLTVLLTLGSWAAVGFAGLTAYPSLLGKTQDEWETDGYGVAALVRRAGASAGVTNAVLLIGAATALAVVVRLARRHRLGDRGVLSAAVVAACVFSPVSWLHYAALLLVPVALFQQRLGPAWFAPLVLWATPFEEAHGDAWRIALWLLVVTATPCLAHRPLARGARTTRLPLLHPQRQPQPAANG
jgi:hypothetical protein